MNGFSEQYMTEALQVLLGKKRGKANLPNFLSVLREVPCKQGVVDILASRFRSIKNNPLCGTPKSLLAQKSRVIRAYSALHYGAPRTARHVSEISGLSEFAVEKFFESLVSRGFARKTETGSYILSRSWNYPQAEFWAFELKISNWKRALFQTLQYRAFAHRAVAVFPTTKEQLLTIHQEKFRRRRLGLMLFDPNTMEYRYLVKPACLRPLSLEQYYYAYASAADIANKST